MAVRGAAGHAPIAGEIAAGQAYRRNRIEPVVETERDTACREGPRGFARGEIAVAEHELARDKPAEPAVRGDQSGTAIGDGKRARLRGLEQGGEVAAPQIEPRRRGGKPGRAGPQRVGAPGELVGKDPGEKPAEQRFVERVLRSEAIEGARHAAGNLGRVKHAEGFLHIGIRIGADLVERQRHPPLTGGDGEIRQGLRRNDADGL